MSQADWLVRLEGFSVARSEGREWKGVLSNVSVQLRQAQIVALVGPNGCGKTTLLRGLVDELQGPLWKVSGTREYNHNSLQSENPRDAIGFVRQQPKLFPWLTVRDNVLFGPRRRSVGRASREALYRQLREALELGEFEGRRGGEISGGQLQRAALAQVLATRPRLLLLDEPFSAADPGTREALRRALLALVRQNGTSIVLVTHDLEEAACLGSRLVVLGSSGEGAARVVAELVGLDGAGTSPLERARIARAVANLFIYHGADPISREEVLRVEVDLKDDDCVHVITAEVEREYENPSENPFFEVVCSNLKRGVKYRYYLPDYPGRVGTGVARGFLAPNVRELLSSLKERSGLAEEGLKKLVQVLSVPRREVLQLSGDSVLIERGAGTPLGWFFPISFDYAVIFQLGGDTLTGVGGLVAEWVSSGRAELVYPLAHE